MKYLLYLSSAVHVCPARQWRDWLPTTMLHDSINVGWRATMVRQRHQGQLELFLHVKMHVHRKLGQS